MYDLLKGWSKKHYILLNFLFRKTGGLLASLWTHSVNLIHLFLKKILKIHEKISERFQKLVYDKSNSSSKPVLKIFYYLSLSLS